MRLLTPLQSPIGRLGRVTLFFCGNPARGDDALGYHLYQRLAQRQYLRQGDAIRLLYDMQWQPEDALAMEADRVSLFVDCAVSDQAQPQLERVRPQQLPESFSHRMTPEQLLWVCGKIGQPLGPELWVLRLAGHCFDLGAPLSESGERQLRRVERELLCLLAPLLARAEAPASAITVAEGSRLTRGGSDR